MNKYEILNFPLYIPLNMKIYNLNKDFNEYIGLYDEKEYLEYDLYDMFQFINSSYTYKNCTFKKLRDKVIEKYGLNKEKDEFYINFICFAYMADIVAHIISYSTTKDERHLDFFKNKEKAPLWMGVEWEDIFTTEKLDINFTFKYTNQELNLNNMLIFNENANKNVSYNASLKIVDKNLEILEEEYIDSSNIQEFSDVTLAVIIKRLHEIMDVIKKDYASNRFIEHTYLHNKDAKYIINYIFNK